MPVSPAPCGRVSVATPRWRMPAGGRRDRRRHRCVRVARPASGVAVCGLPRLGSARVRPNSEHGPNARSEAVWPPPPGPPPTLSAADRANTAVRRRERRVTQRGRLWQTLQTTRVLHPARFCVLACKWCKQVRMASDQTHLLPLMASSLSPTASLRSRNLNGPGLMDTLTSPSPS